MVTPGHVSRSKETERERAGLFLVWRSPQIRSHSTATIFVVVSLPIGRLIELLLFRQYYQQKVRGRMQCYYYYYYCYGYKSIGHLIFVSRLTWKSQIDSGNAVALLLDGLRPRHWQNTFIFILSRSDGLRTLPFTSRPSTFDATLPILESKFLGKVDQNLLLMHIRLCRAREALSLAETGIDRINVVLA